MRLFIIPIVLAIVFYFSVGVLSVAMHPQVHGPMALLKIMVLWPVLGAHA